MRVACRGADQRKNETFLPHRRGGNQGHLHDESQTFPAVGSVIRLSEASGFFKTKLRNTRLDLSARNEAHKTVVLAQKAGHGLNYST